MLALRMFVPQDNVLRVLTRQDGWRDYAEVRPHTLGG
jgi:hypothetical protein